MESLKVENVKVITDLCLLITFSNGERKIFDATHLLNYPVYEELKDFEIFKNIHIQNGIITWKNGEIDIDTQTVYDNSLEYEIDDIISAG